MTNNNSMVTIPQIRRFKVRFEPNSTINETIDNLHVLEEYIRIYGRSVINKITFYFTVPRYHSRKIILRRSEPNDRFRVEFRTQDDNVNVFDYVAVVNKINTTTNLYEMIGRYIVNPFQVQQNMIMMPLHQV